MEQIVGEQIGRHEIICPLGEGGMAVLYLALCRGPANVKKLVVLKQIRSELARDKRLVTMFLDEARLATRLNHPNVVHTYSVLEDAGKYILTMEYLEGQSFADVLQRIDLECFPLEEYLWILTQVLAGLQYAHALADYDGSPLGVVHRDVSPGNTFITYAGDVKVLDFGIAKASGAISVTQKGTFKGKLSYCAPEQIQGDGPIDARADIFAVGAMLWEALARARIDVGESFVALAQTRLTAREPKIRELCPDVSPVLADICERAMALEPTDRYLTAADFQRDLERYLDQCGRRVGRAEVSELMRRHFDGERRQMQKRIEKHLRDDRVLSDAPVAFGEVAASAISLGLETPVAVRSRWTLPPSAPKARPRTVIIADPEEPDGVESSVEPSQELKSMFSPAPVAVLVPAASNVNVVRPRRFLTARMFVLLVVLFGSAISARILWQGEARPWARLPFFARSSSLSSSSSSSPLALPPSLSASPAPEPTVVGDPPAAVVVAPEPAPSQVSVAQPTPQPVAHRPVARVSAKRMQARKAKPRSPERHLVAAPAPATAAPAQPEIELEDATPPVHWRSDQIDETNPYLK